MKDNDLLEKFGKPISLVKVIARNPTSKVLVDDTVSKKRLASLRSAMFIQPSKRMRKAKGTIATRHKPVVEQKKEVVIPRSEEQKDTPAEFKGIHANINDLSYCCDCFLPLECDPSPWEVMKPSKAALKCGRGKVRFQAQQQMEDYLSCVNRIYGKRSMIPFGLHNSQLYLFERAKLLGQVASDISPSNPLENWTPREVAVFEAAISVVGKEFHLISNMISTKSTQEVIEFYYEWKFSSHYYSWKAHYKGMHADTSLQKK